MTGYRSHKGPETGFSPPEDFPGCEKEYWIHKAENSISIDFFIPARLIFQNKILFTIIRSGNRARIQEYIPPLIDMTSPVMYPLSAETRKATRWATSSGVPNRFTGIIAFISFSDIFSVISVLINPGATALTVIPLRPTSCARALVPAITPPLAAE